MLMGSWVATWLQCGCWETALIYLLTCSHAVGLFFCFSKLTDQNIFIILYGLTSVYFAVSVLYEWMGLLSMTLGSVVGFKGEYFHLLTLMSPPTYPDATLHPHTERCVCVCVCVAW